ncbi:helix-turn-helix domain-containing protein [Thalassiella azotivora]
MNGEQEQQRAAVAAQIRQERKRRGWSQEKLADTAGVAKNTVNAMENGRSVRPGNLRAVLDALEIDPLAERGPTPADDDAEFGAEIIRQWLRQQPEDQRARAIKDLMRFVVERNG